MCVSVCRTNTLSTFLIWLSDLSPTFIRSVARSVCDNSCNTDGGDDDGASGGCVS